MAMTMKRGRGLDTGLSAVEPVPMEHEEPEVRTVASIKAELAELRDVLARAGDLRTSAVERGDFAEVGRLEDVQRHGPRRLAFLELALAEAKAARAAPSRPLHQAAIDAAELEAAVLQGQIEELRAKRDAAMAEAARAHLALRKVNQLDTKVIMARRRITQPYSPPMGTWGVAKSVGSAP